MTTPTEPEASALVPIDAEVLDADAVALICNAERKTVVDKMNEGLLPGVKIGREWICTRTALLTELTRLSSPTSADELRVLRPQHRSIRFRGRRHIRCTRGPWKSASGDPGTSLRCFRPSRGRSRARTRCQYMTRAAGRQGVRRSSYF